MANDVPVGNGQLCWRMFAQLSESSYIMCRMGEGVAEQIGVKRTHYIEFETGNVDYYPKEIVDKLAGLYQIPVEDLLDGMIQWPDNQPSDWYYINMQEATNSHDFKQKGEIHEHWTKLTENPDWDRYR